MPHAFVRSPDDCPRVFATIANAKMPMTISWCHGYDRTHDQNALMWAWAGEVSYQTHEHADKVQARWKLDHGCPILAIDNPGKAAVFDALKAMPRTDALAAMDLLPVTRVMKTGQFTRLLQCIQQECAEQGLELVSRNDDALT